MKNKNLTSQKFRTLQFQVTNRTILYSILAETVTAVKEQAINDEITWFNGGDN